MKRERPAGNGADSTNGRAAGSKPTADVGQDDDGALFSASTTVGAYGTVTTSWDTDLGARRRDDGMRRVDVDNGAAEAIRAGLDAAIASGQPFSADQLHDVYRVPLTVREGALGAAIRNAAREGRIRKVGFEVSTRPGRRAGGQYVWLAI